MKVGFGGLGHLGKAMAKRLVSGDQELVGMTFARNIDNLDSSGIYGILKDREDSTICNFLNGHQ